MRLEEQILAECCRVPPGASQLRLYLCQSVDWPLLTDLAKWHGLRPLLAGRIAKLEDDRVPPAALMQLRDEARAVAYRNLFLAAELDKILRLFAAKRIQAFSLKGPSLAVAAYGGVEGREFEDLDVFIHRNSFREAQSILNDQGYQASFQLGSSEARYLDSNCQLAFMRSDPNICIELHWGLQERKFLGVDLRPDAWWERLEVTAICGYPVHSLAPADLILFLCLHGAKHSWERWKWIYDVAGLIESYPVDAWTDILGNALRLGALPILLVGLALASAFTGVSLPDVVADAVKNTEGVVYRAILLSRRIESALDPQILSTALLHLQLIDNFESRLRYLFEHAFVATAADWQRLQLAAPFQFLYPVLRPFRFMSDRMPASMRRLLRK